MTCSRAFWGATPCQLEAKRSIAECSFEAAKEAADTAEAGINHFCGPTKVVVLLWHGRIASKKIMEVFFLNREHQQKSSKGEPLGHFHDAFFSGKTVCNKVGWYIHMADFIEVSVGIFILKSWYSGTVIILKKTTAANTVISSLTFRSLLNKSGSGSCFVAFKAPKAVEERAGGIKGSRNGTHFMGDETRC